MSKIFLKYGKRKFEAKATEKQLKAFGRQWIGNARRSLTAQGARASGELYDSFPEPKLTQKGNMFGVDITPQVDYWEYLDKGVRGSKRSPFPRQNESPFAYTTKMPPAGALDRWAIVKGLQGIRGDDGRFIGRKSLVFLIRKAIFERGIKPRLFITGTKERIKKKGVQGVGRAITTDIANALRLMIKETDGTNN